MVLNQPLRGEEDEEAGSGICVSEPATWVWKETGSIYLDGGQALLILSPAAED